MFRKLQRFKSKFTILAIPPSLTSIRGEYLVATTAFLVFKMYNPVKTFLQSLVQFTCISRTFKLLFNLSRVVLMPTILKICNLDVDLPHSIFHSVKLGHYGYETYTI